MEDFLEHFNIKGSHWHVRRYQNPDGTLTPEGKLRYSARRIRKAAKKVSDSPAFKSGPKGKASPAEKIANTVSDSVNRSSQRYNARIAKKSQEKARKEASEMSDEELRRRINRLNMERQYADLSRGEVSKGRKITGDVLEAIGYTAAIAGSAAAIVSAVYSIRHPESDKEKEKG